MDKRYIEINPIDKIDEMMSMFKDFSPKLFSKNEFTVASVSLSSCSMAFPWKTSSINISQSEIGS